MSDKELLDMKGRVLMTLEDIAELFGLDINDLTLDGNPEYRREKGT